MNTEHRLGIWEYAAVLKAISDLRFQISKGRSGILNNNGRTSAWQWHKGGGVKAAKAGKWKSRKRKRLSLPLRKSLVSGVIWAKTLGA